MKVKIRTYEDMVKEYGKDSDGDINGIPCGYNLFMEKDLPSNRIIEVEKIKKHYDWVGKIWHISKEMIEEFITEEGKKIKIKIKPWSVTEEKYGLDSQGNINLFCSFTRTMEKSLPKNRIIEVVKSVSGKYKYAYGDNFYSISRDMIEEYIEEFITEDPYPGSHSPSISVDGYARPYKIRVKKRSYNLNY